MSKSTIRSAIYHAIDAGFPSLPAGTAGKVVRDVERYAVLSRAGYLRSRLVLASARAYEVPTELALPFAVIADGTHGASLIEDDKMDKQETRRGKPACYRKFGKGLATLAVHGLLADAGLIMMRTPGLSDGARVQMRIDLDRTVQQLVKGQEADIYVFPMGRKPSLTRIIESYENKTGAPLAFSARMGARLGNAPEEELEILRMMGLALGVAYQGKDDLDDVEEDRKEKKVTLPLAYGIPTTKRVIRDYRAKALSAVDKLASLGRKVNPLRHLIESKD